MLNDNPATHATPATPTPATSAIDGDAGGNVSVYERPREGSPLAPLLFIVLTSVVLLVVVVLLWRQN